MEDKIIANEAATEDVSDNKLADDLAEDVTGAGGPKPSCNDVLTIEQKIKILCHVSGKLKR